MLYAYTGKSTKSNEEDEDPPKSPMVLPVPLRKKPYAQYEHGTLSQHTHFYISDQIGPPDEYTEMIHRILTSNPSDVVFIHLNTPGGHVDTAVQIINAMQNSAAKTITVLEATAFSMGTMIFLAGDEMIVNDHCMMMFHNFKGGVVGKGNELTSQLEATVKWFTSLAKKIYIPFLSEEEFERIMKGEDIWMQSAEIRRRLDKMFKGEQQPKNQKQKRQKKREITE